METPWFPISGSYSGALSAWLRGKWPHIFAGAYSSSGVVNPFYEFSQYDY